MKTLIRFAAKAGPRLWPGLGVGMACLLAGAGEAAVTISVESVGAAPGEKAVVRVLLDDAAQIAGGTFRLGLPEFVEPGPAATTADTAGFLIASRPEQGRIAVSLARASGLPEGSAIAFSFPIRLSREAPQGAFALEWEQAELYAASLGVAESSVSGGRLVVLPPPPDSDDDGLPDSWEKRLLGGLGSGPEDDTDGDGAPNHAELLAGTDPGSAGSVFRVGRFEVAEAGGSPRVTIEWRGDADRPYEVYWSDGPLGPGTTWRPVYRPVFQVDGTRFRWTDDGTRTGTPPLRNGERYYRIRSVEP